MKPRTALIMAGGTGGHIFPGLALAEALHQQGWQVHWLGTPGSMESQLVPEKGFAFHAIDFSGVRGKGLRTLLAAPWRVMRACWQSLKVLRRIQAAVVVGFGGYVTFPGGVAARLQKIPLVLHEQNSVAGMANRLLARIAAQVFAAFPHVLPSAQWVGNPLRRPFTQQPLPAERFAQRAGPLQVLVVGGSLGAKGLNDRVPQALSLLPIGQRPRVRHQSGRKQMEQLAASYQAAGVEANLTPFIDDMATALAQADVVIGRAGASTVTEMTAIGVAALYVPFPHAVDDHQTTNARFVVDQGGGWLIQQADLTPQVLADFLKSLTRAVLLEKAQQAKRLEKTGATDEMVRACESLLS